MNLNHSFLIEPARRLERILHHWFGQGAIVPVMMVALPPRARHAMSVSTMLAASIALTVGFVKSEAALAVGPAAAQSSASGKTEAGDAAVGPWTRNLPKQGEVTLLGIRAIADGSEQWWRPDGLLLSRPADIDTENSLKPNADQIAREFVVRIPRSADGSLPIWRIAPSDGWMPAKNSDDPKTGDSKTELTALQAVLKKDTKRVTLLVGIPTTAKWKTRAASDGDGSTAVSLPDGAVLFAPRTQNKGDTHMVVSFNLSDPDLRLVAVDHEGREHEAENALRSGVDKISQICADFPLLPQQIKEFRLQTRPIEWVEFKDVEVNPSPAPGK